MNTIKWYTAPEVDIISSIPDGARERALWFSKEFGETFKFHLANLRSFCSNLPQDDEKESKMFSEITSDGFIHANYGRFHIYFPLEKTKFNRTSPKWNEQFSIEIDNKPVMLESRLSIVKSGPKNAVRGILSRDNIIDTLHPPRPSLPKITSQNTPIHHTVRIKRI